MQVGLRHFDSQTLDWFADALRSGDFTRHALARDLCERTGLRNPLDALCLSAAAKALPTLAERLGPELPPARDVPDPATAPAVPSGEVPDTRLTCRLEELGPVSLDPVGDADDRRLWEAMMEEHHRLGWARPPGGQMRYWIRSERHGVLGGIGFGSATWQLRARDEWIGWSADARAANIGRVLCNHPFLILPGVRVHTRWRRRSCAWPRRGWRMTGSLAIRYVRWRPTPMSARNTADTVTTAPAGLSSGGPAAAGAGPARCGRPPWRTAGGRRSAMWTAARSARWRAPSTARTRTGRRGSTAVRATPTGGCAAASSGWAGPG